MIAATKEKKDVDIAALLARATKPSADAMRLHPFYRGKTEIALKCTVRDFNDFAIPFGSSFFVRLVEKFLAKEA